MWLSCQADKTEYNEADSRKLSCQHGQTTCFATNNTAVLVDLYYVRPIIAAFIQLLF